MTKYYQTAEIPRVTYLGGGHWNLSKLNEITVIFGKNGSGKSILLRQWRNHQAANLHYIVPERVGNINFAAGYLETETTSSGRQQYSQTNLSNEYRQRIITRIQAYFMTRGSFRSNYLEGDPGDLEELLSSLVSDFSFLLKTSNPPYEMKRLSNGEIIDNVDKLSSGESQIITLALDILTIAAIWDIEKKEQRLILIDEPDAHLHPDLQVRLADFICSVAVKYKLQVVIATHSTTMLSALGQFGKRKTSIIYLNIQNTDFQAKPFSKYLLDISSCLGGHLLMGPLFGAPLLLVEGDDDYRIWSQVPRHGVITIAVLTTNGEEIKKYQKNFESIFASLCEKSILGFALLDRDKPLPRANLQRPQDYIPFIRLSCHEAENLYLSDEVLSDLSLSWNEAKEKLIEESKDYGTKKELIDSLVKANRKTVDLKSIINEVSRILDPKNAHWTTRIGNRLGRERPTGQLADFLGDKVVNSLWGTSPKVLDVS